MLWGMTDSPGPAGARLAPAGYPDPLAETATDRLGRAEALGLSMQTGQDVTWSRGQFVIDGTAVSTPDAVLVIAQAMLTVRRARRP